MELVGRLNEVIKKDKQINPQYMKDVIRSDIFYLLNNYFEVEYDDVKVAIDVDNNNKYTMSIVAVGDRLKAMQIIPN